MNECTHLFPENLSDICPLSLQQVFNSETETGADEGGPDGDGMAPLAPRFSDAESNLFIDATIDERDGIRYLLELNETENEI